MIKLIRRLFGTRIEVTQNHINNGSMSSMDKNPVALAVQERLDLKYGSIGVKRNNQLFLVPKKEIYIGINMTIQNNRMTSRSMNIGWPTPHIVRDFLDRYDYDRTAQPFHFYYCI